MSHSRSELRRMEMVFKKWFSTIDTKSATFLNIYSYVVDTYWTTPEDKKDNEEFANRKLLQMLADRAEAWHVEVMCQIGDNLFQMVDKKVPALSGQMEIKGKMYYFKFYDRPESLDNLQKMLTNTVIQKHKQEEDSNGAKQQ